MSASSEQFQFPSHDPAQFTEEDLATRAAELARHFDSRSVTAFPLQKGTLVLSAYVKTGELVGVGIGVTPTDYQEPAGNPAPRIGDPANTRYYPQAAEIEIDNLRPYFDARSGNEQSFTNKLIVAPEERTSARLSGPEGWQKAAQLIAETDLERTLFISGQDMLKVGLPEVCERIATHRQLFEQLGLTRQTTDDARQKNQQFADSLIKSPAHIFHITANFYERQEVFVETTLDSSGPHPAYDELESIMRVGGFASSLLASNYHLGGLRLNPIMPFAGWHESFNYRGGGEYEAAGRQKLRQTIGAIADRGVDLVCAFGMAEDTMGYLDYFVREIPEKRNIETPKVLVVNEAAPEDLPYTRNTFHVQGDVSAQLQHIAFALESGH